MREMGGLGDSQPCFQELSETTGGKNASEEQKALTVTGKPFPFPGLVKLSLEVDVLLLLDI